MKVGDILVYVNEGDYGSQYYTLNKHYKIYKIENSTSKEYRIGYIKDDKDNIIYFTEEEAENVDWMYLKNVRKLKLRNINICSLTD